MTTIEFLSQPLPKTYPDYQGVPQKIKWPRNAKVIARCGDVFMMKNSKYYYVIYGLDVAKFTYQYQASDSFGPCCIHQARCEGLMD